MPNRLPITAKEPTAARPLPPAAASAAPQQLERRP